MAIDSQWSNVSLLLPLSNDLLDARGHVITASNGAALSSTVGNPWGAGNALYCDGVNDVLTATGSDFILGTADCSIQFWFYPLTGGHGAAYGRLLAIGADGTNGALYILSSTSYDPMRLRFEYYSSGYVQLITENTTTISNGAWHFFQLDRVSNVWSAYVDGTLYSTKTTSFNLSLTNLSIGANTVGGTAFKGYFSDIRITKGAYRTSHSIPSNPFPRPTITGTVYDSDGAKAAKTILIHDRSTQRYLGGANSNATTGVYRFYPPDFGEVRVTRIDELADPMTDETIFDLDFPETGGVIQDRKGHTLTLGGNAAISTSIAPYSVGASCSFDGVGDYVQATSSDFALGYADFSIELMFRPLTGGHNGQAWSRLLQIGVNATAGTLIIYSANTFDPMQVNAQFYDTAYRDLGTVNTTTLANGTWHTLQLRRVNGVFELDVNGTVWCTSSSVAYNLSGTLLSIGANTTGAESFYGNIGPVRISVGPTRAGAITSVGNFLKPLLDGGSGENAIIYDRVIPGG